MKPAKGVLLYGPPGTGKTMLAKVRLAGVRVLGLFIRGQDHASKGESEGLVRVRGCTASCPLCSPTAHFVQETGHMRT